MGLPFYLAMTGAEIYSTQSLPEQIAYMACHFSPYSTGLSNLPDNLPSGSLLMLNDRIPIYGHDPHRIAQQLQEIVEHFSCSGIVLDLQRERYEEQHALCRHLAHTLSCPVAVSELYAAELECPVFLSAPPVNCPLSEYAAPYTGREIWLETATDAKCFTVTRDGCTVHPIHDDPPDNCLFDDSAYCRYTVETNEKAARFRLWRTADDLKRMSENTRITRCIGLYQELFKYIP